MSKSAKNKEPPSSQKLLIDNPADFQFHAAYSAYSDIYDKVEDPETKKQLNQSITDLQQSRIDYQAFYTEISRYRSQVGSERQSRAFIKTQRKRDWRRVRARQERNKRHKK